MCRKSCKSDCDLLTILLKFARSRARRWCQSAIGIKILKPEVLVSSNPANQCRTHS